MYKKSLNILIFAIALGGGLIHLINSAVGLIVPLQMRPLHLAVIAVIALLGNMLKSKDEKLLTPTNLVNVVLIVMAVLGTGFIGLNFESIAKAAGLVATESVVYGSMLIVVILVIAWRSAGPALSIIAGVFILYALLGHLIPGILGHRGYSFARTVNFLYTNGNGIFGVPIDTSARYLVLFMIMGEFIERSGTGKLFIAIADCIAKCTRGGAAKASIVSSALFGCISGTPIANIMVTGTFTIPMMKRSGFSGTHAAAISATAATGGIIMPPIMGAGAFILAELLGISYAQVMYAAIIPSVVYYLSLYLAVDFYAAKNAVEYRSEMSGTEIRQQVLLYCHTIIPLVLFVGSVMVGYSVFRSAIVCIIATPPIAALRKETRMSVKSMLIGIASGMKNTVSLGAATACAGIIVGVIAMTGFGFSFADLLASFKDMPPAALLVTMAICIVMGMGMPAVASYLITATIAAPALINMGFAPIAVHMFIFYFSCFSSITPPVALASYTAAGVAQTDPWETGYVAFKLAIVAFLCPFIFIYSPALLGQGSLSEMFLLIPTTFLGTYSFTCGVQGYLFGTLKHWFLRIPLLLGGILMIIPGIYTDLIGLSIVVLVSFINKAQKS